MNMSMVDLMKEVIEHDSGLVRQETSPRNAGEMPARLERRNRLEERIQKTILVVSVASVLALIAAMTFHTILALPKAEVHAHKTLSLNVE